MANGENVLNCEQLIVNLSPLERWRLLCLAEHRRASGADVVRGLIRAAYLGWQFNEEIDRLRKEKRDLEIEVMNLEHDIDLSKVVNYG